MNTFIHKFSMIAAAVLVCCFACTPGCTPVDDAGIDDKLAVVVTLSFFEDMVSEVAGEKAVIKALVPVGVEPEEYEPLPGDIRDISSADVFIYNGHNMERWLPVVIPDLGEWPNAFALAECESIEPILLPTGPFADQVDPHAWTDAANAVIYVEQIAAILAQADPVNEEYYTGRAAAYIGELQELDRWIRKQVALIPLEHRILVTSELCFQYLARAYGFEHDAIWAINHAEEGTPSQIARIIDLVREKNVRAVFVENQVDHRPMERVSRETGIAIGGVLFSDSLSLPGRGGETYTQMMRANILQIVEALAGEEG